MAETAREEADRLMVAFQLGERLTPDEYSESRDAIASALSAREARGRAEAEALLAAGRERAGRMEKALAFYRDGFQYKPKRTRTGVDLSTWEPTPALLDDCGETARAALTGEQTNG